MKPKSADSVTVKTAPRIFIFSTVLGAENLSYVKSIETHGRAFLTLNILSIGTVAEFLKNIRRKISARMKAETI
jgi:hypothetical protein